MPAPAGYIRQIADRLAIERKAHPVTSPTRRTLDEAIRLLHEFARLRMDLTRGNTYRP